jgi:hypothetical protein
VPNELVLDDVRRLWQSDAVDEVRMPVAEVRRKAARFQNKIRMWNAFQYAAGILTIVGYGRLLLGHPSLGGVFGILLLIAAPIAGMYLIHEGRSARSLPQDMALNSCLDFHRREVERQRDFLLRSWRYLLLPVPGMVVLSLQAGSAVPSVRWRGNFELAVIVIVFFLAVTMARRLQARKMQREIEALVDLAGGNNS